MKILGSVNKMRIQKTGMTVIARGLNILVKSCHGAGDFSPCACLRSSGTVIKVVIDSDRRVGFIELGFVQRDKAARPCVDDVVRKDIVRHVPLHLELTRPCSRSIILVESVVYDSAVIGVSPLRRIASDGNARGMTMVN